MRATLNPVRLVAPVPGGNGAGLGNEDVALEAESLGAGEIKHISRGVQLNFCEGRFDLQFRPKLVRKGELRAGRREYGRGWRREWVRFGTELLRTPRKRPLRRVPVPRQGIVDPLTAMLWAWSVAPRSLCASA
jgi:hypothetical protein